MSEPGLARRSELALSLVDCLGFSSRTLDFSEGYLKIKLQIKSLTPRMKKGFVHLQDFIEVKWGDQYFLHCAQHVVDV